MPESVRFARKGEKRQAARAVGRDSQLPRFFSGQLATEALEARFSNLATTPAAPLIDAAGRLVPVEGIDY